MSPWAGGPPAAKQGTDTMNQPDTPRSPGGSISTWAILFTVLITISWTLWGWGNRGPSAGPLPPVRDMGALELPLAPVSASAWSAIPPERLRPQPRHAVHRIQVDPRTVKRPDRLVA
jgi:hypothetical protein